MRHQWLPLPQLFALSLLALVLIVAVACGAAEEVPTTAPAMQATEAPAMAMTESTPSSSSGDAMAAATATPAAMPDTSSMMGPTGTFNYGVSGLPPFHVFPTVTEGAAYHHNGYTTAETLLYMNEAREIIPRLFKEWEVAPDGVTWTFKVQEGVKFHKG